MMKRLGCYDPALGYKPQWAYATPDGLRDEVYLIPFEFDIPATGRPVLGLPLQMDDDQPFFLRAIIFNAVGPFPSEGGNIFFPGLVRMRDTHGNPVTGSGAAAPGSDLENLIFSFGVWGLSGFQNVNAFGFCFEPEIVCEPGGSLLFDFILSSNGSVAQFVFTPGPQSIRFYAVLFGAAGNGNTIELIDPGAPNVALSAALVGGVNVQVTLATDGGGVITSTFADVGAIMAATPAVAAVMGGVFLVDGLASALAQTPLVGGANGTTAQLRGTLIGVKGFTECS